MRVAVIGGGITGLTTAWHLKQADMPLEVVLLEKTARLGGCIHTERHRGFIVEHGPDVFLARKPEAIALCDKLDVPTEQTTLQRYGAFIRRGTRLHRLPEGLSGLVPTRLGPLMSSDLLSVRGRLRVMLDLLLPSRQDGQDESVAAFFRRRLGKEAFAYLIEPVLGGITGGRAELLSMEALFPQLRTIEREYGSILIGLSANKDAAADGTPMRSVPGGLGRLIEALARYLGSVIRCETEVTKVTRRSRSWYIHIAGQEPVSAQVLVLAVPARVAGRILQVADVELATELAAVPYTSTVAVNVAISRAHVRHPLNGHGYLISRHEESDVAACTWSSSKLAGRAPESHVLLRVFMAGKQVVDWSDESIKEAVMEELEKSLGVSGSPSFVRIKRYAKAMPRYELGHADRVSRIRARLALQNGLYIAGPMFDGIGIPDCIRSGIGTAESILHELRSSTSG